MRSSSMRKAVYDITYVDASTDRKLSWFNKAVIALTVFAITISVLSTEKTFVDFCGDRLKYLELSLGLIFSGEICLRVWSSAENPRYAGLTGRLRFLMMPTTLLDIIATAPLLLVAATSNTTMLRILRLIRLVRFAKLGRYTRTLHYFSSALRSHWPELVFSLLVSLMLLLLSATALFLIEGPVQPAEFGSIPRAMWWSIETLTTVGYGDVVPITTAGKVAAGFVAITGVSTVAMPAGIFAAAFGEAFRTDS